jgi:MFS transporter, putative metabolite:H+ symporter
LKKYLSIIFVAVPVWYVMGTLVLFSPELSVELGLPKGAISSGKAIMFAYTGITVGDLISGFMSQFLRSRKKTLLFFLLLTIVGCVLYFLFGGHSTNVFYGIVVFIGFATGYWAVFISTASELFGTNIRSTATTTVPNFVRASTILISALLAGISSLAPNKIQATIITGAIIIGIGLIALFQLEETFGKDLDYTE